MKKIAVITKNKEQYNHFMVELSPEDRDKFIYVNPKRFGEMRGLIFSDVIRYGEYYKLENFYQIYDEVKLRIR